MKTVDFVGRTFRVEGWWNYITRDEDGEINLFYHKPEYRYWNGYMQGRFWDSLPHSWEYKTIFNFNGTQRLYAPEVMEI